MSLSTLPDVKPPAAVPASTTRSHRMALRSLAERLQARSPDSPQTSRELHANARARQTGHYFRYRLARRPAHAVAYGEMVFREPKTTKCRRRITLPGVVVEAVRAHR